MGAERHHGGRRQPGSRPDGPEPPYAIIDSARVFIVDPCHIAPRLVRALVRDGFGVLVQGAADGAACVRIDPGRRSLTVWAPDEWWHIEDPVDAELLEFSDEWPEEDR